MTSTTYDPNVKAHVGHDVQDTALPGQVGQSWFCATCVRLVYSTVADALLYDGRPALDERVEAARPLASPVLIRTAHVEPMTARHPLVQLFAIVASRMEVPR